MRAGQVGAEVEFYDTEKDPCEINDLAENSEFAEPIKRMKSQLESWMAQQGDLGIETELSSPKSSKEAQWKPRLEKYYKANKDSFDRILKEPKKQLEKPTRKRINRKRE